MRRALILVILAACGEIAALPVAQSWLESRYGHDPNALATRNPLGLLDYSGQHPVRWLDGLPLCTFPTWAAAFAEWTRRVTDPSYKEGVYQPWEMTLEQFIVTYVAGPGCWRSRGTDCANGEDWQSCQRYLARTIARLNRYHGLDERIVRIFNVYGPAMRPADGRVVSNFLVQALQGKPLTVFGDGSQSRSFCYVDDMIRGIVGLLDSDYIGPVNIGNPNEFTVSELAELVLELTGSSSEIEFLPLPKDDPRQRQPDITLARERLGWSPTVELEAGLARTIEYFKEAIA